MQQSCRAAVRVKPKARLCEPWVMIVRFGEPRSSDREFVTGAPSDCQSPRSPLRGSIALKRSLTQGSQSLALGLILTAAPQLCLRFTSTME